MNINKYKLEIVIPVDKMVDDNSNVQQYKHELQHDNLVTRYDLHVDDVIYLTTKYNGKLIYDVPFVIKRRLLLDCSTMKLQIIQL